MQTVLHIPGEGHCCLGVACEVAGVERSEYTRTRYDIETQRNVEQVVIRFGGTFNDGGSYDVLPFATQVWLGVNVSNPAIALPEEGYAPPRLLEDPHHGLWHGDVALACLNDEGWTFEEIADAIEQFGFAHWDDALENR